MLPHFTPNDIISKPPAGDYIPRYDLIVDNTSFHSAYFLSLILKSLAGLSKQDAENKALELQRLPEIIVKTGPLESIEMLATTLSEQAGLTVFIKKSSMSL